MQLVEIGKKTALTFSYREIQVLLAFSSTDEKVPSLNGASVRVKNVELSTYATDGRKSVRGQTELADDREDAIWMIPRSELVWLDREMIPGLEVHFLIHPENQSLYMLELWDGSELEREIKVKRPIEENGQENLPFEAVDTDLAGAAHGTGPSAVKIPRAAFRALNKLALAGSSESVAVAFVAGGMLRADTEGETKWSAVVKLTSTPEKKDESVSPNGDLVLSNPEPRKRGRRKALPPLDETESERKPRRPRKSSKVAPIGSARGKRR
jgi:hypothetical protein